MVDIRFRQVRQNRHRNCAEADNGKVGRPQFCEFSDRRATRSPGEIPSAANRAARVTMRA